MADLSLDDFVKFSFRMRKVLPYYNGDEQELNHVIDAMSDLLGELTILRDWICIADEWRQEYHKSRTKRLEEYLTVMFGEKNKMLSEEQKSIFERLKKASLYTNLLTATAVEMKTVKGLSPNLVKYICDGGDKFIERRKLKPYFIHLPFHKSLSKMRDKAALHWGEDMSGFNDACGEKALSQMNDKKRKLAPTDNEPQSAEAPTSGKDDSGKTKLIECNFARRLIEI
ncbi:hypothetical protein FALBO_3359 [Fusarium albosuccineum]|uniref:Uncharacterized protein n=1 Tax=Fusarium albosuccineum TaxID=1237068 RepID=A0A8H4LLC5_9HYPO|nr:hypothetical protein FALBO_3359 [Fusarium albosuccineum]